MTSPAELIIQARKEALAGKDNEKALTTLDAAEKLGGLTLDDERLLKNTRAFIFLETQKYREAADIYKEINELYQAGFCELLLGNEAETERLWDKAPDSEPCRWGKCLLDFIQLKTGKRPTFLQVRNHLENDIGYFIKANKIKYAENLIKNEKVFISVNLEAYKLIGRVLLNHGFMNMARKYILKSMELLPNESETLYYWGLYNYQIGSYEDSRRALAKCLEYNYCYTPARTLLGKVEQKQGYVW